MNWPEVYHRKPLDVMRDAKRRAMLTSVGTIIVLAPIPTHEIARACDQTESRVYKSLLFWEKKGRVKQKPEGWLLSEDDKSPLKSGYKGRLSSKYDR